ncbi:hypothetical protein EK904_010494 [Melospiza melodia maxima]|nr:hypothetical protein EK904_010494 [Melospiza melodia maxima]
MLAITEQEPVQRVTYRITANTNGCRVLVLESVNLFRKYISFLDVLISCLLPRDELFILTEEETEQAKRAMRCHRSQLLGYRQLYLLFSRYLVLNSLRLL